MSLRGAGGGGGMVSRIRKSFQTWNSKNDSPVGKL